jgi:hypothetical protein
MADKNTLAKAPTTAVAAFDELPHFQYNTPTVTVDDYVLDAEALNAYIRRAESAYGRGNVTYCVGKDCPKAGKGDAEVEADTGVGLVLDCSGFAAWSTYRKGVNAHTAGKEWVQISKPIPGATVRYDPKKGHTYGHSGVIIAPAPGDNFQTLDSTDAKNPPRNGSIVYRPDGRSKWLTKGGPNPRFLVSTEAIISKGGVPYTRPTNLLLAAAKHPVAAAASVAGLLGLVVVGFFWYKRSRA